MSDIDNKINYLKKTKELIKNALIVNGADIKDEDTFRSYADKINNIDSFNPLDICKCLFSIESFARNRGVFIYKNTKTFNAIKNIHSIKICQHNNDYNLYLEFRSFDEKYAKCYCRIVIYPKSGYLDLIRCNDNWEIETYSTNSNSYYMSDIDLNDIFYLTYQLNEVHPLLQTLGFSEVGKPVLNTTDFTQLKCNDVFGLNITSTDAVLILKYTNGDKYLFKIPNCDKILFDSNQDSYNFSMSSKKYEYEFYDGKIIKNADITYSDNTGVTSISINANVLVATEDIYDENDNLLFEKNASIEDFI